MCGVDRDTGGMQRELWRVPDIQSETARQQIRQQADAAWQAGSLHLTGAPEKYPRTGGRQSTMPAWVDSASEARGGSNVDLHTSAGGDTQVAAAVAVPGRPKRRHEHEHGQDTAMRNQMQGTHTDETSGTPGARQQEAGKARWHSGVNDSRGAMEGTAHMAVQMMTKAAAGAEQQDSMDSARDSADTVRTHVNGSEC